MTNGYTTDAQISQDDVRALKDDKSYQVNYFCSTVVRKDALEKYPKLKRDVRADGRNSYRSKKWRN